MATNCQAQSPDRALQRPPDFGRNVFIYKYDVAEFITYLRSAEESAVLGSVLGKRMAFSLVNFPTRVLSRAKRYPPVLSLAPRSRAKDRI